MRIFALILCLVLCGLAYKTWVSLDHASSVMAETFPASSGLSVMKTENIYFTARKYSLVNFMAAQGFDPEKYGFMPVTLCQVRGFPLRTPLFKNKIPPARLEDYTYYWRAEESGKTPPSNRQMLIALGKTGDESWLLRTSWLSGKAASDGSELLRWQQDSFYAKKGCKDMGI